ncbi:MAG: hypothetical protein LUQ37_03655, partial [Methanoregulaceae archaeon]|nr:hypothetical protein [Methanoregulaceae archaeon]
MIRHPSLYFIKYLMTQDRPEAQDNNWVCAMVTSLGYPKPHQDFLAYTRAELHIPASFQPRNRYHRESAKFMRQEGIWSLHNPDAATREATLIITNLRVRPTVEQLLLGHIEPKEVAKKVNSRFSEFLTSGG